MRGRENEWKEETTEALVLKVIRADLYTKLAWNSGENKKNEKHDRNNKDVHGHNGD